MTVVASIGPVRAGPEVLRVVGRPTRRGPTWLWLQDDLDLQSVPAARAELAPLLAAGAAPRFVLVYVGVDRFVDMSGLRLLVETARRVRSRGTDLIVVAPPHCLRLMVAVLGLGGELSLAADARQALRRVRARR